MSNLIIRPLTSRELYMLDDYRLELDDDSICHEHSMQLRGTTEKKTNASMIAWYESEMMRRGISHSGGGFTRKLTQLEFITL